MRTNNAFALPRFSIVRTLGEGGMGIVYEAIDNDTGGRVALKAIRTVTPESLVRFKREFRTAQDLQHPNLVSLGELVATSGHCFFTMELVEGVDFLEYVRPADDRVRLAGVAPTEESSDSARDSTVESPFASAAFDERRLRGALGQLLDGLEALHASGKVHRDIKPSNIRVTGAGRLVVLDFGLVVDHALRDVSEDHIAGTVLYMAPEQASSGSVGPEADLYAVGVLLFEALSGTLPFQGSPLQILMDKQSSAPAPPSSRVNGGIPEDLDALCVDLMSFAPRARPTLGQARARLGGDARTPQLSIHTSMSSVTHAPPFVGRAKEHAALRRSLELTRAGAAIMTLVRGESGVGKSCLVKKFVNDAVLEDSRTLVLTGRCYERETIPYKAFDGVLDGLTRRLAKMPEKDAMALLPSRAGALALIFPALRRVQAVARGPAVTFDSLDPIELRRRAFAALREMLTRVSDRTRTIVVIDDLQWADADSLSLLLEVMRPPDPPALLIVCTMRNDSDAANESVRRLLAGGDSPLLQTLQPQIIDVERLSAEDARELARELIARSNPSRAASAELIAAEAGGHPLFIDELVRHAAVSENNETARPLLDDALWARVSGLGAAAGDAMALLAITGQPTAQETIARAAGVELPELTKTLALLRVAHLARTTGPRPTDPVEPYHDRVREAVLAHLPTGQRRALHERVAVALEASRTSDPEALAEHWDGAGDRGRALRYSMLAADRAAEALAFARAASLYRRAIELHDPRDGSDRALRIKLGDVLASAGRGALAADEYEAAAEGSNEAEALDLRRRAAEQLLRGGHFDRGMTLIRIVLRSIGLNFPRSTVGAFVQLLLWRAFIALRGHRFVEKDPSRIAARDLTRIDTCWSVAFCLALSDHIYGALFQARTLIFALRSGERTRIALALSSEVGYAATRGSGGWSRTKKLSEEVVDLAKETGDARALAFAVGASGLAHYLNGHFTASLALCDRAEGIVRELTGGRSWEATTIGLFAMNSLAQLGELRELQARQPVRLREALDRGDVYAAVNFRIGHPSLAFLAGDNPEIAREQVAEGMRAWSQNGFHIEHYYATYARTNIELYAGNPHEALKLATAGLGAVERSLLRRIQAIRVYARQARARAAIAVARVDAPRAEELLALALLDARRLEREGARWSSAIAALLRVGVAAVRGDSDTHVRELRNAATSLGAADMRVHAAVAEVWLGEVLGGHEGATLRLRGRTAIASQEVRRVDRFARLIVPGAEDAFG